MKGSRASSTRASANLVFPQSEIEEEEGEEEERKNQLMLSHLILF